MGRRTYGQTSAIESFIFFILFGLLMQKTIGETSVQVSVVVNPIQEDGTAIIQCQTWDVPNGEMVAIDFERQGRQPQIVLRNGQFDNRIGDNFYTSRELQNDGSTIHTLTITYVHQFDAGIYRCKVGQDINGQFIATANGTTYLDVLHFPADIYPTCHIVGFDKGLTRAPGSEVHFGCTSEYGSPRVNLDWTRTGDGYMPPAEENGNGALYSEIRVTLTQSDNGVAFTCTARSSDDADYISICLIGPFEVTTEPQTVPPVPPNMITTAAPPTPTPNTRLQVSAPGTPFQEGDFATVTCQVWDLASNYVLSMLRTTPQGTETLVYNALLLGQTDSNFEFDISEPQNDNSTIFTLTISNVHRSDSGVYTCTIYRPTGPTNSYAIKATGTTTLDVTILPTTEPPVFATVSITISSSAIPIVEGNRVYIQCVASGLLGNGLVMSIESSTSARLGSLAHDNQLSKSAADLGNIYLAVQDDSAIDGTVSYFLTFNEIRRIDTGTYRCIVRRSSGSEEIVAGESKNIEVAFATTQTDSSQTQPPDMNRPYLPMETRVVMNGPDESVLEDGVAALTCQIWGLFGDQGVYIERTTLRTTESLVEDNQLKDSVRDYIFLSLQGQTDGSVIYYITMRFIEASESGTYTCYVNQPLGTNSFLTIASESYYLNVVVPTKPPPTPPPVATVPATGTRAILTLSDNPAQEGSTVLFQCHVYELFFNHIVSIERNTARGSESLVYNNEIPFSVADNFFVSILPQPDGSTMYYMTIRDVHRSDMGTYTCTIYNAFGSVSNSIITMGLVELDVAYLPDVEHPTCSALNEKSSRKYRVGDELSLGCTSGFGKPRVGIHWSSDKGEKDNLRGSFKILDDKVHSELTVKLTKDHNMALFTCTITSGAYSETGRNCTIGPYSVSGARKSVGGMVLYIALSIILAIKVIL